MRDYTFFVYILASRTRVLYVGVTNSVERRTREHQEELEGFCRRYKVWRLVHYERFQYIRSAIAREKQIKSWSRWRKVALIEASNPTWEDLSLMFGSPARLGFLPPQTFGAPVAEQQIATSGFRPPRNDRRR